VQRIKYQRLVRAERKTTGEERTNRGIIPRLLPTPLQLPPQHLPQSRIPPKELVDRQPLRERDGVFPVEIGPAGVEGAGGERGEEHHGDIAEDPAAVSRRKLAKQRGGEEREEKGVLGREEQRNRKQKPPLDVSRRRLSSLRIKEHCPNGVHRMHPALIADLTARRLGNLEQTGEGTVEGGAGRGEDSEEETEDEVRDSGGTAGEGDTL
jgi:hypothetical protein